MTTTPALSRCTVETNNNSQPNKIMIFTQKQYQQRLSILEAQVISLGGKPAKDDRDVQCQIFGMAESKVLEIYQRSPKGKLLESLAKEHLREEKQRESKATASAPVRPASTAPAATAPAMPSAANIASALLDETERRRVASLTKTRAEFSALKPAEAMKFCKAGGKIVN